jgi:hypothetical protein
VFAAPAASIHVNTSYPPRDGCYVYIPSPVAPFFEQVGGGHVLTRAWSGIWGFALYKDKDDERAFVGQSVTKNAVLPWDVHSWEYRCRSYDLYGTQSPKISVLISVQRGTVPPWPFTDANGVVRCAPMVQRMAGQDTATKGKLATPDPLPVSPALSVGKSVTVPDLWCGPRHFEFGTDGAKRTPHGGSDDGDNDPVWVGTWGDFRCVFDIDCRPLV